MIRICNFQQYCSDPFGIPTVISRKYGEWFRKLFPTMEHWIQLAPKPDLFGDYCDWRRAGLWTQEKFDEEYVPRFIKSLYADNEARNLMNWLYLESHHAGAGLNVNRSLICYCSNELMCHRMIIAGLLAGTGVPVQNYDSSPIPDRMKTYYDMYKNIKMGGECNGKSI